MIRRPVATMAAAAALLLAGCGSSKSGLPRDIRCGHSSNGVLCLLAYAGEARIRDVIGYYSPTTSLAGDTWRLNLFGYDCNPARPGCRPTAQYPATARHTPPPVDGKCIAVLYDAGRRQCAARLATAYGTHGDWTGLPALPSATLAAHAWLCVSAQLLHRHGWHDQFPRA